MTPTTPTAAGVSVEVEAIRDLLDTIHAGRFVPLANSECLCKSVLDNAETALTALLASAAGGVEPVAWRRKESRDWWVYYETKAHEDLEPLYAAPPPPVGELQGVSEAEVQKALRDYGWFVTAENEANMRRSLESFAASRPVADKDAERMRFLAQRGGMLVISDDANNSFTVEVDGGTDSEGEPIVTSYTGVTLRIAIDMAMDATKAGGAS
jgi:hypothetical protein